MKRRFVQIEGQLVEVGVYGGKPRISPDIMPDIAPYKSMIDGSEITSRSHHRAHLKENDCVEVGNETAALMTQYDKFKNHEVAPQQLREVLRAQVDKYSHSEFKQMLGRDLDRVRWQSRKD